MEIIKRIWNYLFPEKKKVVREPWMTDKVIKIAKESIEEFKKSEDKPKPHTQLFRNQQLPGKIYNIGKSRFRINKKLTETADGRLKYIITKLI